MATTKELEKELESLKRENEALKQASERKVTLKVSEKGAVSLYGLGRFPVTLYQEQWTKILTMKDAIEIFIRDNRSRLKSKE